MNIKYLLLVSIWMLLFAGCKDSNTEDNLKLELSESSFENISSEGTTLAVEISSSNTWTAETSSTWCKLVPAQGASNQPIKIVVDANLNTTVRDASIVIASSGIKKTITVNQQAGSTSADEYHYELPVIFHVLYKNSGDPLQYVSQNRLAEILNAVNDLYKDRSNSIGMNLTFTLATTNPDGETLTSPGVEYIEWPDSYPIDCDAFMSDNTGKNVKYLWDPNQYINVMIYNFASDPETNSITLGISHLPFTTTGNNSLEGLNETKYSYLELKNLNFPYCCSINSLYIDQQSTSTTYNTADVTVTVAHELGHYLGVHHVFSEDENGTYDGCTDSDYCKDTPTYNKVYYDQLVDIQLSLGVRDLPTLALRENCTTGQKFTSRNIMDYAFSYSDQFTQDQHDRIRHVLAYSPLIPGPKKNQTKAGAAIDGVLELPIRTVK